MNKTRRLTLMALLSALALGLYVAESQLPPVVPVAGVKLGLANIVTLTAMVLLGRRAAGAILAVRIVLGSIFAGAVSALLFSLAGGLLSYVVLCVGVGPLGARQLWVLSIVSALAHNLGQLLVAVCLTRTPALLYYGLALLCTGIVAGLFTGVAAGALIRVCRRQFPPRGILMKK